MTLKPTFCILNCVWVRLRVRFVLLTTFLSVTSVKYSLSKLSWHTVRFLDRFSVLIKCNKNRGGLTPKIFSRDWLVKCFKFQQEANGSGGNFCSSVRRFFKIRSLLENSTSKWKNLSVNSQKIRKLRPILIKCAKGKILKSNLDLTWDKF